VSETNARGEHVIIPALPDDTMGQFFDHLRAAKGTIYIATLEGDDVAVISMAPGHAPKHAAGPRDECPIHRHTEVQMVVEYLRACRVPVRCYEALPSVLLELLDEGAVPCAK
jgi:hypothetical protein